MFHCFDVVLLIGGIVSFSSQRTDTVRCIVEGFTDSTSELFDELSKGETKDDGREEEESGEDDNCAKSGWEPTPSGTDSHLSFSSYGKSRVVDVIGLLMNIYGSAELFVTEYKTLLAQRLFTVKEYDIREEVKSLELLKLRFGEANMNDCEVMLKDISDSKRIYQNLTSEDYGSGTKGRFREILL